MSTPQNQPAGAVDLFGADGRVIKRVLSSRVVDAPGQQQVDYEKWVYTPENESAHQEALSIPRDKRVEVVARESMVRNPRDWRSLRIRATGATDWRDLHGQLTETLRERRETKSWQRIDQVRGERRSGRTREQKQALRAARFREDTDSFARDFDSDLSGIGAGPEREFLQLLGGPFSKQLYLSDYLAMHAKCFWAFHHNPLVGLADNLLCAFAVGEGVKFKAKDPTFQKHYDEWAKRDNFPIRLRRWARDESWQGELMIRTYALPDGRITVRSLDPSTIWEVIANPEDTEEVYGYWQQYPGPYNIYSMIVNGQQVPYTSYTIRIIDAADVVHAKLNMAEGEKRGRSDFFSGLAWEREIRDTGHGMMIGIRLENNVVWVVTVDGDAADVDAALNSSDVVKAPRPGSFWWVNKGVVVEPMSGKVGNRGQNSEKGIEFGVQMFAASYGIPVEYLGFGSGSTKAMAIAATTPWAKRVKDYQLHLELEVLQPLNRKIWEAAVAAGILSPTVSWEGEFTWPEAAPEDKDAKLARLDGALARRVIDHSTYATMVAAELNITEYDYEATQAKILAQRQKDAASGMAALDNMAVKRFGTAPASGAAAGGAGAGALSPDSKAAFAQGSRSLTPPPPKAPEPPADTQQPASE